MLLRQRVLLCSPVSAAVQHLAHMETQGAPYASTSQVAAAADHDFAPGELSAAARLLSASLADLPKLQDAIVGHGRIVLVIHVRSHVSNASELS